MQMVGITVISCKLSGAIPPNLYLEPGFGAAIPPQRILIASNGLISYGICLLGSSGSCTHPPSQESWNA